MTIPRTNPKTILITALTILAITLTACSSGTTELPTTEASTSIISSNTPISTDQAAREKQKASEHEANTESSDQSPTYTKHTKLPGQQGYQPQSQTESTGTIQVAATGTVEATPDMANITMGVHTEGPSVAYARQEAAGITQKVVETLLGLGVEEKDIGTNNFSIYPVYDYGNYGRELTGYQVSNTLSATVRTIDNVGQIIDKVSVAGGNDLQFENIWFDFQDRTSLTDQARAEAVQKLHRTAIQLATESGREIGPMLSIGEGIFLQQAVPFRSSGGARSEALSGIMADTPINPGTSSVGVRLQAVFALN